MNARFLKWLFVLIPFVYYDFVLDASGTPRVMYLSSCMFLCYLWCFIKSIKIKIPTTFSIIYVCYLVVILLSSLYNNSYVDYVELIKRIDYFLFFILIYNLENKIERQRVISGVILLLWIAIIFGLIQYVSVLALDGSDNLYAISSTFSHKNIFSSILVLSIPFVLMVDKSIQYKAVLIVLTLLMLIVLQTRSALLALFISSTYLFIQRIDFVKKRIFVISISGVFIITSGVFLLKQLGTLDYFVDILEVSDSDSMRTSTIQERFYLWKSSVNMFFDNWLLGVGLGNWAINFPSYGLTLWRLRQGEVIMQRPHNDILENFDELGIIGGGLFLMILLYPFLKAQNTKKHIYCTMGVICFIVISLFSFPQERVVPSILFFTLLGFILRNQISVRVKSVVLIVITSFTFLSCLLVFSKINSEQIFKSYLLNHSTKESIYELETAKSTLFCLDGTSTPIDWYIGDLYLKYGLIDSAKLSFESALKLNPNHMHVLNSLGGCHLYSQQFDSAKFYFNRAIEIAPYYEDGLYNLAHSHYSLGELNQAIFVLERIYNRDNYKFNERILQYAKLIVEQRIELVESSQQREDVLISMLYNNEWLLSIVQKSYENKILFEQQVIEDVTYLL